MVPWLREEEALRLHAALLEDSLRLLRAGAAGSGAVPFVSFSEAWNPASRPGCEEIARAAAGMARIPQRGADLGERLERTFRRLFARGFRRVVVIGSDSPTLPASILKGAFAALQQDGDVVLGPAEDGGYYLVGATRPVPRMFEKIPWGTKGVMRATLAALHRRGARAVLLSPWHDVDRPDDLERVRRHLSHRPQGEPALRSTRAFVQALVRDGRLPIEA
jgi:uncharacterized protein